LCAVVVVMEEAVRVFSLMATVLSEMFDETVVGYFSCMREAAHSLPNFDVNKAIFDFVVKIVFFDDFVGDVFNWCFHAFAFRHWCV